MTRRTCCARSACILLMQVQGNGGTDGCWTTTSFAGRPFQPDLEGRPADPDSVLRHLLGRHSLQALGASADGTPVGGVSRGVPPEQQVLRGAGRLQDPRRKPARRHLPGGLRRAECAVAPSTGAGARRGATAVARPTHQEPRCPRPRAAPRGIRRGEQARKPRAVSRDDRQHHAVHRPVRHRVGDHGGVPGHRRRPARPTWLWWRPASRRR